MDDNIPFKICTNCGRLWDSQSEFLDDPNILFIGYQPHFEDPLLAFLLFNHRECGTTLNVRISSLRNLETKPVFNNSEYSSQDDVG